MQKELSVTPATVAEMVPAVYHFLRETAESQYGILLEPVEAPDPCKFTDDKAGDAEDYQARLCAADSINSRAELDEWLGGDRGRS